MRGSGMSGFSGYQSNIILNRIDFISNSLRIAQTQYSLETQRGIDVNNTQN